MKHFEPGTRLLVMVQSVGAGELCIVDGKRLVPVPIPADEDGKMRLTKVVHEVVDGDVDVLASPIVSPLYAHPSTSKPYEADVEPDFRVIGMQLGIVGGGYE